MIYAIVAMDDKQGIATEAGIPWDLPTDKAYFREKTIGHPILMGYRMYAEFTNPLPSRRNLVAVRPNTELKTGFEPIENTPSLLEAYLDSTNILWIVGGAALYTNLLPETQKLYITRVQGDFNCTKFFPDFKDQFEPTYQAPAQQENGISFRFEVWQRKQ
jgi:dihydrofolate reductase